MPHRVFWVTVDKQQQIINLSQKCISWLDFDDRTAVGFGRGLVAVEKCREEDHGCPEEKRAERTVRSSVNK